MISALIAATTFDMYCSNLIFTLLFTFNFDKAIFLLSEDNLPGVRTDFQPRCKLKAPGKRHQNKIKK